MAMPPLTYAAASSVTCRPPVQWSSSAGSYRAKQIGHLLDTHQPSVSSHIQVGERRAAWCSHRGLPLMASAIKKEDFAPVAPGEMLKQEFLAEYGLSQNQLAKAVGISSNRIADIINNRRRITADTAVRLGLYSLRLVFWK